jgi:hypothetical protein
MRSLSAMSAWVKGTTIIGAHLGASTVGGITGFPGKIIDTVLFLPSLMGGVFSKLFSWPGKIVGGIVGGALGGIFGVITLPFTSFSSSRELHVETTNSGHHRIATRHIRLPATNNQDDLSPEPSPSNSPTNKTTTCRNRFIGKTPTKIPTNNGLSTSLNNAPGCYL